MNHARLSVTPETVTLGVFYDLFSTRPNDQKPGEKAIFRGWRENTNGFRNPLLYPLSYRRTGFVCSELKTSLACLIPAVSTPGTGFQNSNVRPLAN